MLACFLFMTSILLYISLFEHSSSLGYTEKCWKIVRQIVKKRYLNSNRLCRTPTNLERSVSEHLWQLESGNLYQIGIGWNFPTPTVCIIPIKIFAYDCTDWDLYAHPNVKIQSNIFGTSMGITHAYIINYKEVFRGHLTCIYLNFLSFPSISHGPTNLKKWLVD